MSKISRGVCFCEVPRHNTSGLHCLRCEGSILQPDEPLKLTPDEPVTTIAPQSPTPTQGESEPTVHCPFCFDDDFDLVGLKFHLNAHCVVFGDTPGLHPTPTESESQ